MNVNLRPRMHLLSLALIVALAGCATSSPSPSAPLAETADETLAGTALGDEKPASAAVPASQPTALQAEAPPVAATAARSDAAASAPPTATQSASVTATQAPPPVQAPVEAPVQAPVQAPTPVAAPAQPTTNPSVAALLQEELWVTGPPIYMLMFCMEAPAGAEMPAAAPAASWEAMLGEGHVCLWGFPAGEDIAYEIDDAGGDRVAAGTTQAAEFVEGPSVADVMVELSDQRSGRWNLRAASPSAQLNTTLSVEITPVPRLRAVPGPKVAVDHTLESLAAGDQLTIVASGMPANDMVPLGIYTTETGPERTTHFQLVFSQPVRTDGNGRFESVLTIEPADAPGPYCAVIPLKAGYVPNREISTDGAMVCFAITQ